MDVYKIYDEGFKMGAITKIGIDTLKTIVSFKVHNQTKRAVDRLVDLLVYNELSVPRFFIDKDHENFEEYLTAYILGIYNGSLAKNNIDESKEIPTEIEDCCDDVVYENYISKDNIDFLPEI